MATAEELNTYVAAQEIEGALGDAMAKLLQEKPTDAVKRLAELMVEKMQGSVLQSKGERLLKEENERLKAELEALKADSKIFIPRQFNQSPQTIFPGHAGPGTVTLHDFKCSLAMPEKGVPGKEISMSDFKGKVCLVANVASF